MKCAKHMLFKVLRAGFLQSKAGDHGAELQLPAATVPDPRHAWSVCFIWLVWPNQTNEINQTNKNNQLGVMFHEAGLGYVSSPYFFSLVRSVL